MNVAEKPNIRLVLSVFNIIYIAVTIVIAFPGLFKEESGEIYSSGYGAAISVFSLGVLYSFFCDLLEPSYDESRYKKTLAVFSIIKGLSSAFCIIIVVVYYFVKNNEWFIWASYGCTLVPASLVFCEIILFSWDYLKRQEEH